MIWLDEPPYVAEDTCRCWLDCRECTRCDCCCQCTDCPEERWEEANAD